MFRNLVRVLVGSLVLAATLPAPSAAQSRIVSDSAPDRVAVPMVRGGTFVEAGAALGLAAALDRPMRRWLRGNGDDTGVTHAASEAGNALGSARYLIPAMIASYGVARVSGSHGAARDVIYAAAGYAVADITEGLIKTAAGRERPLVHGDPTAFHPFSGRGDYHSFPSGHMTHITSIVTAAAIESGDPWVRDVGVAAVTLTGWQRIHADQHWASDVVAGAIVGNLASRIVIDRLRRR